MLKCDNFYEKWWLIYHMILHFVAWHILICTSVLLTWLTWTLFWFWYSWNYMYYCEFRQSLSTGFPQASEYKVCCLTLVDERTDKPPSNVWYFSHTGPSKMYGPVQTHFFTDSESKLSTCTSSILYIYSSHIHSSYTDSLLQQTGWK